MNDELTYNQQREETEPAYGKRVYLYFILVCIVLISSFSMMAVWQKHVSVKQVSVEGNSILSKDEIVRMMKLPHHVPMYDLDLTALQKNILENSFVQHAVLHRDAPSTLRVVIEERTPAAIVVGKELFYIASDGTILPYIASSETYDIPVISGLDSVTGITAGKKLLHAEIIDALEIINVARVTSDELSHTLSEIRLRKGKDIVLYSFETGIPIIFGKGDAVKKLVKLDAFWQKFLHNRETSDIQYIDIRYEDQVVVSRKNS